MNNRQILVPGDVVRYTMAFEFAAEPSEDQSQEATQNSQASSATDATCAKNAGWRFQSSRAIVIACGDIAENYLESEYCIEMKVWACTIFFGPSSSVTLEFHKLTGGAEEDKNLYCQAQGS
jgi:hypothetical protein